MDFITDKPVNISQLGHELGRVAARWYGPDEDGVLRCSSDDLDQEAWDAAVAAHKPDDGWVDPAAVPVQTRDERVAEIIDAAPDWRSAMKSLASEGLLP